MDAEYKSDHHREDKRQQHLCACICLWCGILFVTILLICITVGLRYTGSRDALTYPSTLGDSRLINYNSFLCSGGTMNISTVGFPSATMYFLDEEPPLSNLNVVRLVGSFILNPSYVVDNDYYFYNFDYESVTVYASWQFHLNPGSEIVVQSCANGGEVYFAVVQGNKDYGRWIFNPRSYTAFQVTLDECFSGNNLIYSYSVTDEAVYYLVYYTSSGTPTIGLRMAINRTEYSTAGLSGMPNCTLGSDLSCSAQSQSSSKYVLFQTVPPNNLNVTNVQEFTFQWECNSKPGAYVFIFFFPLIILALLFCGCFVIYYLCDRCLCRTKVQ